MRPESELTPSFNRVRAGFFDLLQSPDFELTVLRGEEGLDRERGNVDVYVELPDGSRYAVVFFTLLSLLDLFEKNARTGECTGGSFFRAADMVVVESLDHGTLIQAVARLVREGLLAKQFSRLSGENFHSLTDPPVTYVPGWGSTCDKSNQGIPVFKRVITGARNEINPSPYEAGGKTQPEVLEAPGFVVTVFRNQETVDPEVGQAFIQIALTAGGVYQAQLVTLGYLQQWLGESSGKSESGAGCFSPTADVVLLRSLTSESVLRAVEGLIQEGDLPYCARVSGAIGVNLP